MIYLFLLLHLLFLSVCVDIFVHVCVSASLIYSAFLVSWIGNLDLWFETISSDIVFNDISAFSNYILYIWLFSFNRYSIQVIHKFSLQFSFLVCLLNLGYFKVCC